MTNKKLSLDQLMQARYGKSIPLAIDLNETLETIFQHRSIRTYCDKPLPKDTLELLIAAGQSASNSSNLQSWSLVAIEDEGRKDRLAQLSGNQAHIRTCPLFLVWLADLSRLEALGKKRELPHEGLNYLELVTVGIVDAALASQNAALAAESLGLSIVYIGGIRNNPEAVAKELNLPPRIFPVFGMCVGYCDPEKSSSIKPRLPQAAVAHREQYDAQKTIDAVEEYCREMDAFYKENNMKTNGDWAQHSLHRIRGPESLNGREFMREWLKKLGFQAK